MKRLPHYAFVIAGFLLWMHQLAQSQPLSLVEKPPLVLGLGEQRLIRTSGLLKYSVGNPIIRILSLSRDFKNLGANDANGLLVKGIAAGAGDLWIWNKDGSSEHRPIRVEKVSHDERNQPLERALSMLQEAEVLFMGKGTVLRGEIYSIEECSKIAALLRSFPEFVFDQTIPTERLLILAENRVDQWLRKSGYASKLRLEKIGNSLWVRGTLDRISETKTIEKQLLALYPFLQFEIDSLPDRTSTVYFRVFLIELKRSHFRSIGISWPSVAQNAFKVTQSSIQNLLQIDLTLQQLEGSGNAKILSNPELVVRAPGEAELFAGGELPIQNQSRFYSNVSWKNYGLTLRLKVTHLSGDRVRLDIFTEVSHLDHQVGQNSVPGFRANRMKTQVDARFGTPLLLSGLLQQGIREEAKGLPFLRSIPILGPLFGSEDYLNERSELIAILYPHAAPPPPPPQIPQLVPRGPLPLPREWISPRDIRQLQESRDYPWNALK